MAASDLSSAEALLAWYGAMGVDEAIGESPVNSFAPSAAASSKS
jgi:hypothetical protein